MSNAGHIEPKKQPDWVGRGLIALTALLLAGLGALAWLDHWLAAFTSWQQLAAFLIITVGGSFMATRGYAPDTQRPPPTRDAWDGGFQSMDSASDRLARKDH